MAVLVSCTGYATAGKDEFADALVRQFGYVKLGWADKLYEFALVLDPLLPVGWRDMVRNCWFSPLQRLSTLVSRLGWVEAKRIPSVRNYLQVLGTEAGRNIIGERMWVDAMKPEIIEHLACGRHVVVTNTRFANEAEAVDEMDGVTVLISRPGVGPVNGHASDSGEAFPYARYVIDNDSTIEALAIEAAVLHHKLIGEIIDERIP